MSQYFCHLTFNLDYLLFGAELLVFLELFHNKSGLNMLVADCIAKVKSTVKPCKAEGSCGVRG